MTLYVDPLRRRVLRQEPVDFIEARTQAENLRSETGKAFHKGGLQLRANIEGAKGAFNALRGREDLALVNTERAQRLSQRAADEGPRLTSPQQIESVGDAGRYALNTIASQIPNLGSLAALALAGRVGGGAVARTLGVGARTGAKVGQGTGVVGGATALETGSNFPELMSDPEARREHSVRELAAMSAAGGLAGGTLEALPVVRVLNKFGLGRAGRRAIEKPLQRRLAEEAAKGASGEALTEAAQTVISRATRKFANENFEVFGDEGLREIFEAAAAGGVVGTPFGALGGIPRGTALDERIADLEADDELQAVRGQVPQTQADRFERNADGTVVRVKDPGSSASRISSRLSAGLYKTPVRNIAEYDSTIGQRLRDIVTGDVDYNDPETQRFLTEDFDYSDPKPGEPRDPDQLLDQIARALGAPAHFELGTLQDLLERGDIDLASELEDGATVADRIRELGGDEALADSFEIEQTPPDEVTEATDDESGGGRRTTGEAGPEWQSINETEGPTFTYKPEVTKSQQEEGKPVVSQNRFRPYVAGHAKRKGGKTYAPSTIERRTKEFNEAALGPKEAARFNKEIQSLEARAAELETTDAAKAKRLRSRAEALRNDTQRRVVPFAQAAREEARLQGAKGEAQIQAYLAQRTAELAAQNPGLATEGTPEEFLNNFVAVKEFKADPATGEGSQAVTLALEEQALRDDKVIRKRSDPKAPKLPRGDFQIKVDGKVQNVNAQELIRAAGAVTPYDEQVKGVDRVARKFAMGLAALLNLKGRQVELVGERKVTTRGKNTLTELTLPDDLVVATIPLKGREAQALRDRARTLRYQAKQLGDTDPTRKEELEKRAEHVAKQSRREITFGEIRTLGPVARLNVRLEQARKAYKAEHDPLDKARIGKAGQKLKAQRDALRARTKGGVEPKATQEELAEDFAQQTKAAVKGDPHVMEGDFPPEAKTGGVLGKLNAQLERAQNAVDKADEEERMVLLDISTAQHTARHPQGNKESLALLQKQLAKIRAEKEAAAQRIPRLQARIIHLRAAQTGSYERRNEAERERSTRVPIKVEERLKQASRLKRSEAKRKQKAREESRKTGHGQWLKPKAKDVDRLVEREGIVEEGSKPYDPETRRPPSSGVRQPGVSRGAPALPRVLGPRDKKVQADREPKPVFYSQALRVFTDKLPDSGLPGRYLQEIQKLENRREVKSEELKWLGIRPWLEGQKARLSKAQVLAFVASNQIQIVPQVDRKGAPASAPTAEYLEYTAANDRWNDLAAQLTHKLGASFSGELTMVKTLLETGELPETYAPHQAAMQKFRSATPAELKLYDEWEAMDRQRLIFDEDMSDSDAWSERKLLTERDFNHLPPYVVSQLYRRHKLEAQWQQIVGRLSAAERSEALALVNEMDRLDEVITQTTPEPMYESDEEIGFDQYSLPGGENYTQVALRIANTEHDYRGAHFGGKNVIAHMRSDDRVTPDGRTVSFVMESQSDWAEKSAKKKTRAGEPNPVPRPPAYAESWPLLAFKYMLRDAVENGKDYIAWPATMEQLAEIEGWDKHNLPKQAERVIKHYTKELPQQVAPYIAQWGAKVGKITFDIGVGEVNAVKITPEMRQSVLSGQPAFDRVWLAAQRDSLLGLDQEMDSKRQRRSDQQLTEKWLKLMGLKDLKVRVIDAAEALRLSRTINVDPEAIIDGSFRGFTTVVCK